MKMMKYYSNYLREIYGLRHNYEKVPLEEGRNPALAGLRFNQMKITMY